MSNSLSTLHTNTKTDPIVVNVFTNQANVLISRADAVIMIPAHFFSAAQLLSCIYHDNLRHGNCRVPIVTTPSWFYQSQLAPVPAHREFCCERRWWLQERHTQRKKRCSVTDSLDPNSADKIFNSLELSDLTSLEMAISISWLKYWGAPPFSPWQYEASTDNSVAWECGPASFGCR